ncbi:MAG: putative negative regulator of RcsB-dependent stress response [Planctomycetota bacterium]
MDIYQTEDEQVEALKKWWQDNGKSAIFGVILGLMAIFGWREWKDYQLERAVSASHLYQQMLTASRENTTDTLSEKANEITASYKNTVYAVFAKLALAKLAVADGDLDAAASNLQWALDNNSQSSLEHVITFRLARVLIAQNKLGEARILLSSNTQRGEFDLNYQELEADILREEGNVDAAREAYQKAFDTAKASDKNTAILELKLDDLGRN